ncbi:MAG: FliM/FliN family flagellar motor switch protein [bacterium]
MPPDEHDENSLFDETSAAKARPVYNPDDEEDIPHGEVEYIHDVPITMVAQVGAVKRTMREILQLKPGATIEFEKVVGEPMDVLIGGRLMCRGEIVVVNERYGIRISEVIRAEDTDSQLKRN